jgi:hypothetical protein
VWYSAGVVGFPKGNHIHKFRRDKLCYGWKGFDDWSSLIQDPLPHRLLKMAHAIFEVVPSASLLCPEILCCSDRLFFSHRFLKILQPFEIIQMNGVWQMTLVCFTFWKSFPLVSRAKCVLWRGVLMSLFSTQKIVTLLSKIRSLPFLCFQTNR